MKTVINGKQVKVIALTPADVQDNLDRESRYVIKKAKKVEKKSDKNAFLNSLTPKQRSGFEAILKDGDLT